MIDCVTATLSRNIREEILFVHGFVKKYVLTIASISSSFLFLCR